MVVLHSRVEVFVEVSFFLEETLRGLVAVKVWSYLRQVVEEF